LDERGGKEWTTAEAAIEVSFHYTEDDIFIQKGAGPRISDSQLEFLP
jgi:hypothetical protein